MAIIITAAALFASAVALLLAMFASRVSRRGEIFPCDLCSPDEMTYELCRQCPGHLVCARRMKKPDKDPDPTEDVYGPNWIADLQTFAAD
ncbi:MAG: hypothetical protein FJ030_02245 [Chloroflexi bacterium]|nr:hypothetical protein [Chloroflexota bacterium]